MFKHVIHDGYSFYLIDETGALRWYQDAAGNGADSWAENSGNQIGAGWGKVSKMFPGSDPGEFYIVDEHDDLRWYKDDFRNGRNAPNGTIGWHPGSGKVVGSGWGNAPHLFPGPDGVIYAVTYANELLWYRHWARPHLTGIGTNGRPVISAWENGGVGQRIGVGWLEARTIVVSKFAAPPGYTNSYVIYLVKDNGDLCWYMDTRADGTSRPDGTGWSASSGRVIGTGWRQPLLVAGSAGRLYLARPDGVLRFYQDILRDGNSEPGGYGWATNGGAPIGSGWVQAPSGPTPQPPDNTDGDGGGGSVDTPNPVGNSPDDPEVSEPKKP